MKGPKPAFIIMRKEFRFVRGHVDIGRAVAFAAFAGEAKIQAVFNGLAFPSLCDRLALEHLKKKMRAAAGGIFLIPRDPVARAHEAALFTAAFAHADAAQDGARKTIFLLRKMKLGL